MHREFSYSSRSRSTAICGLVCGVVAIGCGLVWKFTDGFAAGNGWIALGLVTGFCTLVAGCAAIDWLFPVHYRSWIRDGVFGWDCPRAPRQCGEVPLTEISTLRWFNDHLEIIVADGEHRVPWRCVRDERAIAEAIVRLAPSVRRLPPPGCVMVLPPPTADTRQR